MSRRTANPAADRAAQNAQTIKALLKLEGNKVCADCKRNKHPRWASWNLGIFVCIRCSGIHRGMGTHISRVKSVDLDSWTDEQLQSVLKWGNSRANKYWEAKLAPGHMPSEAKIENFIRTKYDSKRWVMDGPMPDPATLDADGDDDVPLNLVQEKAKIERSASQRMGSAPQPAPIPQARPAPANVDLFGDEPIAAPPIRPSTADIPSARPTQVAAPAAFKPMKPQGDSLFGIDFFGGPQTSNSGRPSSALANPTTSASNPRGDLKSSILSLYATAPKPQPQAQATHDRQPSFGGMTSPPSQPTQQDFFGGMASPPSQPKPQDPFSGMNDAFRGLSFPSTSAAKPPPPQNMSSAFSGFNNFTSPVAPKATPAAPQVTSPPPLSGGSFFDSVPAKPQTKQAPARAPSNGLDFSFTQASTTAAKPKMQMSNDLFASDDFAGFAAPSAAALPPAPPPTKVSSPAPPTHQAFAQSTTFNSAFNLSSPTAKPAPPAQPISKPVVTSPNSSMFDAWGSGMDNAWGAPVPAQTKPQQSSVQLGKPPSQITPNDITGGWGAPISSASKPSQPPTVTADEDFGGWTSASTQQTPISGPPKQGGGFGAAPDPFDNPWG